jgi:hypothetical protein
MKWKLDALVSLRELLVVKQARRNFRLGRAPLLLEVEKKEETLLDRNHMEAMSLCAKALDEQKMGHLWKEIPLVKVVMFAKTPGDGRYYS